MSKKPEKDPFEGTEDVRDEALPKKGLGGKGIPKSLKLPPKPKPTKEDKEAKAAAELEKKIREEVLNAITNRNLHEDETAANKEWYAENGTRRWRCNIRSNRPGVKTFEMVFPHPKTGRPIPIHGRCGYQEDGLNLYVIACLQETYHVSMQEDTGRMATSDGEHVMTHKENRVYDYNVEILDEVENPKPIGRVNNG